MRRNLEPHFLRLYGFFSLAFTSIGVALTKLQTLDLFNSGITDSDLSLILKSNVKLESLRIERCYRIENMDAIVQQFPNPVIALRCSWSISLMHVGVKDKE